MHLTHIFMFETRSAFTSCPVGSVLSRRTKNSVGVASGDVGTGGLGVSHMSWREAKTGAALNGQVAFVSVRGEQKASAGLQDPAAGLGRHQAQLWEGGGFQRMQSFGAGPGRREARKMLFGGGCRVANPAGSRAEPGIQRAEILKRLSRTGQAETISFP